MPEGSPKARSRVFNLTARSQGCVFTEVSTFARGPTETPTFRIQFDLAISRGCSRGVSSPARAALPKQSPSRGPSRQRGWMSALRRAARRHPESGSLDASLRRACCRVFRQSRVHSSTPPRSPFWLNQPSGCRSFRWLDLGEDVEMLCTSSLSLPGTISGSEPSAPRGSRQAPVTL